MTFTFTGVFLIALSAGIGLMLGITLVFGFWAFLNAFLQARARKPGGRK